MQEKTYAKGRNFFPDWVFLGWNIGMINRMMAESRTAALLEAGWN
jgi:hypothetical protein